MIFQYLDKALNIRHLIDNITFDNIINERDKKQCIYLYTVGMI